jgi:Mg-chelatase subunit ChlD
MKPVRRERLEYEGTAVAISVVFHIVLFVILVNLNASPVATEERQPLRFKVSKIDMPLAPLPPEPPPPPQKAVGSPTGTRLALPGVEKFTAPPSETPVRPGLPAPLPAPAIPQHLQVGAMPTPDASVLDNASVNRDLMAMSAKTVDRPVPRPTIEAPLRAAGPEMASPGTLTDKMLAAMKPGVGSTGIVEGPITQSLTEIFGQGGKGMPLKELPSAARRAADAQRAAGAARKPAAPLEPYVNVDLFTWHPPNNPAEGYYQIQITSKAGSPLRVVPRDVIYVMDVSGSMTKPRVEQFKAGVRAALTRLNPGDRFNVICFRQNVTFVSPRLLPAAEAGSRRVQDFIAGQSSQGMTDFYGTLLPLSQLNRERGRLLMATVMSDGLPTTGMRDTLQILQRFQEINARRSSVFTFTGGADVDKFLLGFLAYRNQGRLDYADRVNMMADALVRQQDALRNPLLLDVDFQFGGVNSEHVYPRTLPHFFRDTPLLLMGRYARGRETGFAMDIRGTDATGQPLAMTIRRYFGDRDTGTAAIAQDWARQRINHLIAQWVDTGNTALHAEAVDLGRRFNVAVPELRKEPAK